MGGSSKAALGIVAGLIVVAVIVWFVFLSPGGEQEGPPLEPTVTPAPPPTPTPTLAERLSERLSGVTLATSDAVVAELVSELSTRPELARWLAHEDMVRRFTASVANAADGRSPAKQVGFLRPGEPFAVRQSGGATVIDEHSYRRYDAPVQVLTSIDPTAAVALYRELEPLMDESFREIAPPGASFQERLLEAIYRILDTMVPSGPIEVERKVVTYTYVDQRLEGLAPIQQLLIRTGPDNARKIQDWLRAFRAELTADESTEAPSTTP